MKRNLAILAFVALNPLYAMGDFVPGRTRASAKADMAVEKSDGRYQAVKAAHAVQFITDGKGATQFALRLDDSAPVSFHVSEIKPARCGQVYLATVDINGKKSILRIEEMNPAMCRAEGAATWRSQVSTDEGNNTSSHLWLRGTPEFYLLSQ